MQDTEWNVPPTGFTVVTQDSQLGEVKVEFRDEPVDPGWYCLAVDPSRPGPGCWDFVQDFACDHAFLADQYAQTLGYASTFGDIDDYLVDPDLVASMALTRKL